ncbi:unnamed protein product [Spirodela intermedia]|uniref:Uncharacterized protein n=1 Tax=Spirodela intermedia TaxID=51605 RepID=A0A7I8JP01_SPIIN|nr:unnamed protein product [Spirodela intermedia]CAA6671491.1 unnamed protein product [Spirodela intermedia]
MVEHLLGLGGTEAWVGVLMVPHQGALLGLDRGSRPVVVQQYRPAPCPLVRRDDHVHIELPEILQEALRPVGHVVGAHISEVLLVPQLLLPLVHRHRLVHGLRRRLYVPWVYPDRPAQGRGAPDELRHHQHALPRRLRLRPWNSLPADDVLVRCQVHPVPHGGDDDALRDGVEGDLLAEGDDPVDVHHRLVVVPPVGAVDPLAALLDLRLNLIEVSSPSLGGQHVLEGQQLQIYALEDVHVVHTEQHRPPLELLAELRHPPLHVGELHHRLELPHVDTHRHDLDAHSPPKVFQADVAPLRLVLQTQHAAAAGEEVPGVVEGVEADQVRIEQRLQDLLADGERPVDLGGGEGTVQEETHPEAVKPAPEEGGHHHQMVVVDPDVVVLGVDHLDHLLGEDLVGAAAMVGGEGEHVVEERPQFLLAEPVAGTHLNRSSRAWETSSCSAGSTSAMREPTCRRRDSSSQAKLHPRPSGRRLALIGSWLATMMIRSWARDEGTSEETLFAWSSSSSETMPGTVITRGSRLVRPPPPPNAGKFPDARSRRLVYDLDIILPDEHSRALSELPREIHRRREQINRSLAETLGETPNGGIPESLDRCRSQITPAA